jgi:hypothetical protein
MGLTSDRTEVCLTEYRPNGQQKCYLVLSDEELAKGFKRPVREAYWHKVCGTVTTMALKLAETYAANPKFYGGTFCVRCGGHFPLIENTELTERIADQPGTLEEQRAAGWQHREPQFFWIDEGGAETYLAVGD